MIRITDKSQCCGCTACESVCGRKAITMTEDAQGFKYPIVDPKLCVECGLCEKVCPFMNSDILKHKDNQRIFGLRLKSKEEIYKSQSGGAFKAIADVAIENGFAVYGVALDKDLIAVHQGADTIAGIEKFRGSKYVQSNLDGIFREIESRLRKGDKILFVGTGCQAAGLKSLCITKKIPTENLIIVDLICYGVPSPKYWQDYLSVIELTYGAKPVRANFRDKKAGGWTSSQNSITLSDGRTIYPEHNFYHPILFRRSCNICPFTSFDRVSDITIGDFWGIEKTRPQYAKDNIGISLVLVNTPKGIKIFDKIKLNLEFFESSRDHCIQQQLTHPNPEHPLRNKWEKAYERYGYNKAIQKIGLYSKPKPLRIFLGKIKRRIFN